MLESNLELEPHEHDPNLQVLRGIASFEMAKGLIVLLAGVGVLFLTQKDPSDLADGLVRLLHISPDRHFVQVFQDWADTLTTGKLWAGAALALAYAILRFVEAYGLWYARAWAQWIALVSGCLYLPFEIYKTIDRQSPFHVTVLVVNLAIVLYMAYLLWTGKSLHRIPQST